MKAQFTAPSPDKDLAERHLWQFTAVRDLLVLSGIAASLYLLYWLRGIFFPLFIALALAYLFNPLVTRAESEWRWPRPLTASLVLLTASLFLFGFLLWLGPILSEQITGLMGKLPDYLRALAAEYDIELGNVIRELESAAKRLQSNPQEAMGQIFQNTGRAIGVLTVVFGMALYLMISLLLVAIYFFFFSWHFNTGVTHLAAYLPPSRKMLILRILSRMDEAVGEFFRGRLVISVIVGALLSAGWLFTGVPYWFFLGMLTGFLNIIPYLSAATWPVAILLKYVETTGSGGNADFLAIVAWPSLVYITVQLLESWVLTPWIQSGQTRMNPATILVVVFVGGSLAGIWGLLFAIPFAACVKILFDELILPGLRRRTLSQ